MVGGLRKRLSLGRVEPLSFLELMVSLERIFSWVPVRSGLMLRSPRGVWAVSFGSACLFLSLLYNNVHVR